jgi:hypothetical protein
VTALTRPRNNCTVNYGPVLSSEGKLQSNNHALSEENQKEKEKLVAGHRWVPDTKTGRLTVGRKITLTSNLTPGHSLLNTGHETGWTTHQVVKPVDGE